MLPDDFNRQSPIKEFFQRNMQVFVALAFVVLCTLLAFLVLKFGHDEGPVVSDESYAWTSSAYDDESDPEDTGTDSDGSDISSVGDPSSTASTGSTVSAAAKVTSKPTVSSKPAASSSDTSSETTSSQDISSEETESVPTENSEPGPV